MATYGHAQSLADLKNSVLAGPNRFAYLVINLLNGRQKKMIIMGEMHTPFTGCKYSENYITMFNYIKKLSSISCLDIFMEDSPAKGQGYRQTHSREGNHPIVGRDTLNLVRLFTRKMSGFIIGILDLGILMWLNG